MPCFALFTPFFLFFFHHVLSEAVLLLGGCEGKVKGGWKWVPAFISSLVGRGGGVGWSGVEKAWQGLLLSMYDIITLN